MPASRVPTRAVLPHSEVCVCVCVFTQAGKSIRVFSPGRKLCSECTCAHKHTHAHTQAHTRIHAHTGAHRCTRTRAHMRTHRHTRAHTRTGTPAKPHALWARRELWAPREQGGQASSYSEESLLEALARGERHTPGTVLPPVPTLRKPRLCLGPAGKRSLSVGLNPPGMEDHGRLPGGNDPEHTHTHTTHTHSATKASACTPRKAAPSSCFQAPEPGLDPGLRGKSFPLA